MRTRLTNEHSLDIEQQLYHYCAENISVKARHQILTGGTAGERQEPIIKRLLIRNDGTQALAEKDMIRPVRSSANNSSKTISHIRGMSTWKVHSIYQPGKIQNVIQETNRLHIIIQRVSNNRIFLGRQ